MHKKSRTNVQLGKYSDELANGDAADDRDIHEEEDINDDVVDFNGHDSKGYAARDVVTARENNHINSDTALGGGHFLTHPSLMQSRSDIRLKNHSELSVFEDLDMQMEEMDGDFTHPKRHHR